eukprot:scaffold451_cov365-Prasinococcus_capsulatus_cf.AAC.24
MPCSRRPRRWRIGLGGSVRVQSKYLCKGEARCQAHRSAAGGLQHPGMALVVSLPGSTARCRHTCQLQCRPTSTSVRMQLTPRGACRRTWVTHETQEAPLAVKFAAPHACRRAVGRRVNRAWVMSAQAPVANERRKQAVVVGAGPSGSLTAALLAARGWLVVVVEKRPSTEDEEMGGVDVSTTSIVTTRSRNSRSYNIVLNDRGLNALEAAGVDLPEERIVRSACLPLVSHGFHLRRRKLLNEIQRKADRRPDAVVPGWKATYGTRLRQPRCQAASRQGNPPTTRHGTVSISRVALAEQIFLHNQREHAETVRYLFSYELKSVDFDRKVAMYAFTPPPRLFTKLSLFGTRTCPCRRFSLADTPSSSLELSYDLLVGSDGVGSKTRSLLLENEPTFQVQQNTDHMEFRTLLLPQGSVLGLDGRA